MRMRLSEMETLLLRCTSLGAGMAACNNTCSPMPMILKSSDKCTILAPPQDVNAHPNKACFWPVHFESEVANKKLKLKSRQLTAGADTFAQLQTFMTVGSYQLL